MLGVKGLGAVTQGRAGVRMDFNQQSVGTRSKGYKEAEALPAALPACMTGISSNRQMRKPFCQNNGTDISVLRVYVSKRYVYPSLEDDFIVAS